MDTMTGLRQLAERHATMSQPAPRAGEGDVWASLLPRLSPSLRPYAEARRQLGIERYGTPLQANNGRDVLTDALQEALDLMVYMQQAIIEQPYPRRDSDSLISIRDSAIVIAGRLAVLIERRVSTSIESQEGIR